MSSCGLNTKKENQDRKWNALFTPNKKQKLKGLKTSAKINLNTKKIEFY